MQGPRLVRSALPALLAAATITTSLGAQRVIRITANGQPIANAEVSVWSDTARLALARTDGDGTVRLQLPPQRGASSVLVRRLGFVPVRQPLDSRDTVVVSLIVAPTSLPVLSVATKVLSCPNRSDAVAESLWVSAAALYAQGMSTLYLRSTGGQVEETVTPEQRGYGDGSPVGIDRYSGINPSAYSISMRSPPSYAMYERRRDLSGEYWRWRYAPLHEAAAEHFASPAFGERHTFQLLGRSGDATVIGFCPKNRDEADVRGELLVGDDRTLRGARWFFQLPHDDEDAGGEATFVATPFEGRLYVVAVRGSSWRRAGRNLYNQDRFEKSSWSLSR